MTITVHPEPATTWPAAEAYGVAPSANEETACRVSMATVRDANLSAGDDCPSTVSQDGMPEASPAPADAAVILSIGDVFRPAFQVEQFAWSSGATRLSRAAGIQLDRLADGLANGLPEGRRVVALAGSRRGEGCTTLLLCAARRLAERGMRVAMVDADFDNPALGRRLGLLPEAGWDDVLSGRLPLGEAVIESTHDHLAVLPLRAPQNAESPRSPNAPEPAAALTLLRQHYDLVLVDLGHFDAAAAAFHPRTIDAVVLVQHVRTTSPQEIQETRGRLAQAGLAEIGIAENFV